MLNTIRGIRFCAFGLGLLLLAMLHSPCADPIYVRFNTNLGNIDVELLTSSAPHTVANFMNYANGQGPNGASYDYTIINRSVPGFVIQGGGYNLPGDKFPIYSIPVPTTTLYSEAGVSNTRGTLAMALSNGPDTGSNQWFFNLADNSATLDGTMDGGPFTVFGRVANSSSLAVMDQVASEPFYNGSTVINADFSQLPLINYNSSVGLQVQNLVVISSISVLSQTFSAWQSGFATGGPTATSFHDGVPNLLKYLYDIDPTRAMTATDRTALPVLGQATIGGTSCLTLTYRQYALQTGITVNLQTSGDLKNWTTVTNPTKIQTGNDATTLEGDPIMQFQIPISGAKQFIRLYVTQP